jgi:hypothetical protein
MSTKELITSNKDPKTKKVFKEAEDSIRRITQLHLNNPKIKIELDYWDWENEVLGKQDKGDPDAYLYCWVDDKTKSKKEIDDIIEKKGEIWTDHLNEFFHEHKKKVTKEFQKYIDCEGDYSGAGYAIILNGKRAY